MPLDHLSGLFLFLFNWCTCLQKRPSLNENLAKDEFATTLNKKEGFVTPFSREENEKNSVGFKSYHRSLIGNLTYALNQETSLDRKIVL